MSRDIYEEFREAVAYGVRKGWCTFKPDLAPEMQMHLGARKQLGEIPKGIFKPSSGPGCTPESSSPALPTPTAQP